MKATQIRLFGVKIAQSSLVHLNWPDTATLDANLTMESHIKALSSSCFYHIQSFKQILSSLNYDMAISVASALVSSRLDHVNSIL